MTFFQSLFVRNFPAKLHSNLSSKCFFLVSPARHFPTCKRPSRVICYDGVFQSSSAWAMSRCRYPCLMIFLDSLNDCQKFSISNSQKHRPFNSRRSLKDQINYRLCNSYKIMKSVNKYRQNPKEHR